jgi:MYXO-CTERM domain-containing protein
LLEDGTSQNQLYRSDDAGQNWSPLGPLLPDSIRTVATVDVAPSDAERVYVSGLDADGSGVLLRSDDGGESFEAFPLPTDASHDEVPYIAAVATHDKNALYLRTDEWEYDPVQQVANANDALLYSSDGGAHFTELLRKHGKLLGFTFSPDGEDLLVGYGDPVEAGGGRLTEPEALGIYRAPQGSGDFEKRYAGGVGCLTWTARGLYACTLESGTGFSLGLMAGSDFDLASTAAFTKLLRLADVVGPLECPACSSGAICRNYWESACESWGRTDCEALSATPPAECGGAGGESNAVSAAGGAQAGDAASPDQTLVATGSGCACRVGHAQGSAGAYWWLLLAGLWRRRPNATALRAARALRFGDSPSCRKQTARALGVPRRRDPA